MKRDAELFRSLLLKIEQSEYDKEATNPWQQLLYEGCGPDEVGYHARMMIEQGFLSEGSVILIAGDQAGAPVVKYLPDAITNSGHEFLDSVRDENIWRKAKSTASAAGNASIAALWEIAKELAKTAAAVAIGLPT
jgi:hypothetical protein